MNKKGAEIIRTMGKKSRIPGKIFIHFTLFIVIACVLVSGCSIPGSKNTTAVSTSPAITPSVTATTPAVVPGNSTGIREGLLNISVGNYHVESPVAVFIDNVSAGNVSANASLNLSVNVGRHTVRACLIGACIHEDIIVLSSGPSTLDLGDRIKNEIVTGPLRVSIGGWGAELPVIIDNVTVGNVSGGKPLDLKISEGLHRVKVCVGFICENETVEVKFGKQTFVDFGERLKRDVEFSTPTIRIVNTNQTGSRVTVDVEFINPTITDITMSTTVRVAYSYINPRTHWRAGDSKESKVTKLVKAGARTKQTAVLTLTGGSAYIIEVPVLLDNPEA